MRNLKRALSLALASVMVLGLMVVGSGAVRYDGGGPTITSVTRIRDDRNDLVYYVLDGKILRCRDRFRRQDRLRSGRGDSRYEFVERSPGQYFQQLGDCGIRGSQNHRLNR